MRVDVTVATSGDVANAVHVLGAWTETEPDVDADLLRITAVATGRDVTVPELVRALDSGDVAVRDVGVREPSLDEVFLHLVDASTGEVAA